MYIRKLEGKRVYLSPINVDDYPIYARWLNDLSLTIRLSSFSFNNLALAKEKELLERLAKEGHNYSIVKGEELIGSCSLMDVNPNHRTATLGIFIGNEEHRNKGYGAEAIELLLAYGFKVLNLHNIMLQVVSFNENAIRCYQKAGFKEFGRRHECNPLNGKNYDLIYMEILAPEFHSSYLDDKLV